MRSKIKVLVIAAGIAFSWVSLSPIYSQEKENIEKQLRLFSDAFVLIRENYVEEVTVKDLIYGALKGMVDALDPYSQFMEPDVAEIMKEDTEGEFGGLGIRITTKDGYVTVVTPLPDTPAFRLGIMPGDKIVKIEGEDAKGLSLKEAVKKLRGPVGSTVNISVYREGEEDLIDFTVTRANIVPKKVYKEILEGNMGYLRLVEFTEDAPEKFKKALSELQDKKIEGLVLDLRNNPGGLLSAAVEISNVFIDKGRMIVYTKGRRDDQNREFHASEAAMAPSIPLVVLINKGSASGSEIVAGSIKDLSRGIIVGEQSFGKASVQSIIDLEDGSSLRLTTAKYYTPAGNLIHEKGITPDIVVKITKEERMQLAKQQEKIYNLSDEEKAKREAEKIEDPQLARARDILVARKIFLKNVSEEKEEKQQETK